MKVRLECREGTASKFWELEVAGATHTVRFGRIGTAGQRKEKSFGSAAEAQKAAEKLVAEKRKGGYVDVGAGAAASPPPPTAPARASRPERLAASTEATRGALFVKESPKVKVEALVTALREDGKMSKASVASLEGWSPTGGKGTVAIAVHPPTDGWVAIVDSADGAQGIGAGAFSRAALLASQLATDVVWYRVFEGDLAIAVTFHGTGAPFDVVTGDAARLQEWLRAQATPIDAAKRPAQAAKAAKCFAITYEEKTYRTGPDAAAVAMIRAVVEDLEAGRGEPLLARLDSIAPEVRAVALGALRAARTSSSRACLVALARRLLEGPARLRQPVKVVSVDEEILRLAAEEVADRDVTLFAACLARLDAIEVDAWARDKWADTSTLRRLAFDLHQAGAHAGAYACYARLVLRDDEPAWFVTHGALGTLCLAVEGKIALTGDTKRVVERCAARMNDLGAEARDAVAYNLACVYARAGDEERAIGALRRCRAPRTQNPSPETDPDLAILWRKPSFVALLGRPPAAAAPPAAVVSTDEEDEDEDDAPTYEPPPERAVPRLTIRYRPGKADARISRIGGLPNVPATWTAWPETSRRPMSFVLQLVGTAGGGAIDLGDVHVLQVFADTAGDFFRETEHAVILHHAPCELTAEPPLGVDIARPREMVFDPGADDRALVDVVDPEDDVELAAHGLDAETYEAAFDHAFADKVRGVPVGANLRRHVKDSEGRPMELLLELTEHDDFFLWTVWISADRREAKLQIVRG